MLHYTFDVLLLLGFMTPSGWTLLLGGMFASHKSYPQASQLLKWLLVPNRGFSHARHYLQYNTRRRIHLVIDQYITFNFSESTNCSKSQHSEFTNEVRRTVFDSLGNTYRSQCSPVQLAVVNYDILSKSGAIHTYPRYPPRFSKHSFSEQAKIKTIPNPYQHPELNIFMGENIPTGAAVTSKKLS